MAYGPGAIINDRHRILDKLGAGAHGIVYRARDLETRAEVALTFLGDNRALDPEYSRRIEREAGTASYIAPEAWQGKPQALDQRIDVYSLGVLIFRALSGRTPAPSSNVLDICAWATSGGRPSLHALRPSLPTAIDAWVHKALAIAAGDRFQSVASLWTALEGLLGARAASPF